jgi:hypothetical protein
MGSAATEPKLILGLYGQDPTRKYKNFSLGLAAQSNPISISFFLKKIQNIKNINLK